MAIITNMRQPTCYEVAVINAAASPAAIIAKATIWALSDKAADKARQWLAANESLAGEFNRSNLRLVCHDKRTRQAVDVPQHRV